MKFVKLSIVVGTYNRLASLQKCLDALYKDIHIDHEILVIDAGSTDGTLEYLRHLPDIHLVCDGKLIGQAQSFNRVLKVLEGDYVCWLSDDNLVQDGMLDLAVSVLEKDSRIGMVALKVKDITGPYTDAPYIGGIWESGILNCNQGLLRTALLRDLGGFSEDFRDYGIDADLTTRVLLAGYRVVYTKRVAIHHHRDHETVGWASKEDRARRLDEGKALYRQKYPFMIEKNAVPKDLTASIFRIFSIGFFLIAKISRNTKSKQFISSIIRDLVNVSSAAFISKWDLIINFFQPYYLVQKIPEKSRAKWNL